MTLEGGVGFGDSSPGTMTPGGDGPLAPPVSVAAPVTRTTLTLAASATFTGSLLVGTRVMVRTGALLRVTAATVRVGTRVMVRVGCYFRWTPPDVVPGEFGGHDYAVVVCDKWGIAQGEILSAVPTQVEWVLDDLGEALIDVSIDDVSALLLPVDAIPGVYEMQVWRDNELIFWGVPVGAQPDASSVHLTVEGILWYMSRRTFGPTINQFLLNPDFEQGLYGWTPVGVTAAVVRASAGGPVNTGQQAVRLTQATAGVDTYLQQFVDVTSPAAESTFYDLAAWCYIDPDYDFTGPAIQQFGLVAILRVDDSVIQLEYQEVTAAFLPGQWNRLETGVTLPAGETGQIEVRLYAIGGSIIWDTSRLVTEESVGSAPNGSDLYAILVSVMRYMQDPARWKSDLALRPGDANTDPGGVIGAPTGIVIQQFYEFSDNNGVLDALNEYPDAGQLDFEITWDRTGHFRGFEIFSPAKGSIKWNDVIEVDLGDVTDLSGSVDGTQVATSVRYLGQGSTGAAQEVGVAIFPSFLGGRVSTLAQIIQGEVFVTASDINFTAADVGQGAYCLEPGALPVGTVIVDVISSSVAQLSKPAALTANPTTFGVGGLILDDVQSQPANAPVGALYAEAQQRLQAVMAASPLVSPRVRADGPRGLIGQVTTGDVVPVVFRYGWLRFGPTLMRISALTLYPPTEEIQPTLMPVNQLVGS